MTRRAALGLVLCLAVPVSAHDIWVEIGASRVRVGQPVDLRLMLGNHGNGHRDFQLASKVASTDRKLSISGPGGKTWDAVANLEDFGPGPREGYWKGRFVPNAPGLYMAASSFDKVMSYGPVRDIKSAKAFFAVYDANRQVPNTGPKFDRPAGHAFEVVPLSNPATPRQVGAALRVRVLFEGKPKANARVSFIPRGVTLQGEMDATYERLTDDKGEAEVVLKSANDYLVAARFTDDRAKGEGYESIHYSATLFWIVP